MSSSKKTTYPDGTQEWTRNGLPDREDGPAIITPDGSRFWYRKGKLDRDDGPAVEHADGSREWHLRGKLQRVKFPPLRAQLRRALGGPRPRAADLARAAARESAREAPAPEDRPGSGPRRMADLARAATKLARDRSSPSR